MVVKNLNDILVLIKNRAIAVSVCLFIRELRETYKNISELETEISEFAEFLVTFLKALKWQIPKGVKMNSEYYGLLNFQHYVTQAAVEKTAIEKRHYMWVRYFDHYKKNREIIGDSEYKGNPENTGSDPNKEREKVDL